jgi:hypothetical protein
VSDLAVEPERQTLYIPHTGALDLVDEVVDSIGRRARFREVKPYLLGAAIGAHVGCGMAGFIFHGDDWQ